MSEKKDYDTTLARIAGNVAAGLLGVRSTFYITAQQELDTARTAMRIAKMIRQESRFEALVDDKHRPEPPHVLDSRP